MNARATLAAICAAVVTVGASAQIKLSDAHSLSGYATGSYQRTRQKPSPTSERTDIDAAKLLFAAESKPVGGALSFWHQPDAKREVTVLDAYASFELGGGATLRAGKFLSYLGYESFDLPDVAAVSYANGDFLAPIPGYHSGVKLDYAGERHSAGLAVLDSVYSGPEYLQGDGELKHSAGFEGFVTCKALPRLTLFAGFGVDTKGNQLSRNDAIAVGNLWASYEITSKATVAAEMTRKVGAEGDEGYNWLAAWNQTLGQGFSCAFRASGEQLDDRGPGFTKGTIAPGFAWGSHLALRAEYSYYWYRRHPEAVESARYVGVRTVMRF